MLLLGGQIGLLALFAAPILPGPLPRPGLPQEAPIRPGAPVDVQHTISCEVTKTITIPSMNPGMFIHARGDSELGGSARLTLEAKLRHTDGRVWVDVEGEIGQVGRRPTVFTRYLSTYVNVALPVGCRIKSVSPAIGRIDDERPRDTSISTIYGTNLIDEATCRTDTQGTDDGEVGCSELKFREVTVQLERDNPQCRDVALRLGARDLFGLTERIRGDADLARGKPRVELDATTKINGTAVDLSTHLRIEEEGGDGTIFDKTVTSEIFSIARDAPGCEIVGIENGTGRIRGQHSRAIDYTPRLFGGRARAVKGPQGEGNLATAVCRTNTPGPDSGKIGCTRIRSNPITIRLRKKP